MVNSTILIEKTHGTSHRKEVSINDKVLKLYSKVIDYFQKYPDKETAVWVNNMIVGVVENHHEYISLILIRLLNPVLDRFANLPPIVSQNFVVI